MRARAAIIAAAVLGVLAASALVGSSASAGIATAQPNIVIGSAIGTGPVGVAFNPNGTKGYITVSSTDKIIVVTRATGVSTTITLPTCSGPMSIAFTGAKAYLACYNSNSVVEFSPANPVTTAKTIPVGIAPFFIAISPDGTKAYVPNSGGATGTVSVIDTSTDTVTATIPVGLAPVAVAFNPAGTKAYVAAGTPVAGGNVVTMIDVATSTVPAGTVALPNPIPVSGVPYGLAVSPDGNSLWVSRDNGLKASIIDTATNTITTTFNLTGKPEGVTFSLDGRRVYMPMQSGGVAVFDAINQTQLPYLASGGGSRIMAFAPSATPSMNGTLAYVSNTTDNTVSVYSFDYTLPTITGTPPGGTVGTAYSFTPTVTGPSVTVSLQSGTLPPGLSLVGGAVSGTPTSGGDFPVTLRATNDNGFADLAVTFSIPIPNYTISFNAAGGSPIPPDQSVASGSLATQPTDPTLAGNAFAGWWNGGSQWDFATDTVTGPVFLTAHWTPVYTVSFDSAGGTPDPASENVTSGDLVTQPADPVLDGYSFDGWWNGGTEWDFSTDTVTSGIALTAHWSALPTITGPSTADAPLGDPFVWTPTITAQTGYSVTDTGLPDGLGLDSSTGVISGTPTGPIGPTDVTLTVTASNGPATFDVTITVTHGSPVSLDLTPSDAHPHQGDTITVAVLASDSDGNTWDVSGAATITSDFASDTVVGNSVTFNHASPHLLTATFDGATGSALVEVIPAATTPTSVVLGFTGGTIAVWLLPCAGGALVVGIVLLLLRRRRDRSRPRH